MEMQEVAAEALADETKHDQLLAAYTAYQLYLVQPAMSKKDRKKKSWKEWQKMVGLADKGNLPQQMSVEEAKRLADVNDAMVREAFKRKPAQA